jgi:hypothetical protein
VQHVPSESRNAVKLAAPLSVKCIHTGSPDIRQNCPHCRHSLNLHQPDENAPALLLGTCDNCSQWYFIVASDDIDAAVIIVELPSEASVREVFNSPEMVNS